MYNKELYGKLKNLLDALSAIIYTYDAVGGHFHIVLDDDNLRDNDIIYCLNCVQEDEQLDEETKAIYYRLGGILLSMTLYERVIWKGFDWELWKQEEGIE